ncbi:MAG TPA: hypothetical protein VFB36_05590 [Nevskiaceae bacterium]|nr:hypothetical protein [Nevskiaceae bacterium]
MRAASVLALLLAASAHAAPSDQQLADCRAISDDAKRLACYDALAPAPSDKFGMSTVPKPVVNDEPDKIEAHLTNKISGWRKGTLFNLDNGQVWQCIDSDSDDATLDRPAVTIRRNFFGHYWMDLAGSGLSVQVTRIK